MGKIWIIGILVAAAFVACVMLNRGLPVFAEPVSQQKANDSVAHIVPTLSSSVNTRSELELVGSTPNETASQNNSMQQPASLTASGLDNSVIGIAFPLSASVQSSCKGRKPEIRPTCVREIDALAKMAQEPRDRAWAATMETLIQNEVQSQGPGVYSLRNIECRSTMCAVEVESLSDAYIGTSYNFLAANDLVDGLKIFGVPETDDLGRRVSVSLVIFNKFAYKNRSNLVSP